MAIILCSTSPNALVWRVPPSAEPKTSCATTACFERRILVRPYPGPEFLLTKHETEPQRSNSRCYRREQRDRSGHRSGSRGTGRGSVLGGPQSTSSGGNPPALNLYLPAATWLT